MQRYVDIIEKLEQHPGKWLARKTVLDIEIFLSGFTWVDIIGDTNSGLIMPMVNGFAQFLETKYSDKYLDYTQTMALSEAGYDDDNACELYFREWHTFYVEFCKNHSLATLETRTVTVIDLSKRLDQMKTRPDLYSPGRSVQIIYSFVRGVQHACECYTAGARIEPDFAAYEAWLSERSPLKKLCRWDRLLLAEHYFDEQAALSGFFETLEEFRAVNPTGKATIPRAT
jgi:hypothetical protein